MATLRKHSILFRRSDDPEREAAGFLAQGKIVGWFQGPMEFGPRALGARSILAPPHPAGMKDTVNRRVKFREGFRPFAPIVLDHRVADWFEDHCASPYMSFASKVRPGRRAQVQAVTHMDGRSRLQTVSSSLNRRLHRLLTCCEQMTGIPVLLNTSFNVRGEPIVCIPEHALACFARTDMDYLFLEDCVIERNAVPRENAGSPEALD